VAINCALTAFEDKKGWKRLMLNGMAREYGWAQPAREYAAVYEEVALRRAQGNNHKTNSKELTA